jgi:hypothetical protein
MNFFTCVIVLGWFGCMIFTCIVEHVQLEMLATSRDLLFYNVTWI